MILFPDLDYLSKKIKRISLENITFFDTNIFSPEVKIDGEIFTPISFFNEYDGKGQSRIISYLKDYFFIIYNLFLDLENSRIPFSVLNEMSESLKYLNRKFRWVNRRWKSKKLKKYKFYNKYLKDLENFINECHREKKIIRRNFFKNFSYFYEDIFKILKNSKLERKKEGSSEISEDNDRHILTSAICLSAIFSKGGKKIPVKIITKDKDLEYYLEDCRLNVLEYLRRRNYKVNVIIHRIFFKEGKSNLLIMNKISSLENEK